MANEPKMSEPRPMKRIISDVTATRLGLALYRGAGIEITQARVIAEAVIEHMNENETPLMIEVWS